MPYSPSQRYNPGAPPLVRLRPSIYEVGVAVACGGLSWEMWHFRWKSLLAVQSDVVDLVVVATVIIGVFIKVQGWAGLAR